MHLFNMATVWVVVTLVSVEVSVSALMNPAAWRLDPEPQLKMVSRFAVVLGKVMPVWYPICVLLLGIQTWMYRYRAGFGVLLAADVLWVLASVGGIFFLVPLNTRIAAGDADSQRISRIWDRRHRVRTAALAIAAVLLTYVLVH